MQPPLRWKNALISRLKIMAQLDIAERRMPQDGRIKLKIAGAKEMDFRVAVLPTMFGEKVVLRLLDKSNLQLDMTKLGFEEGALAHFQAAIAKPFGMVLVTGPTGSSAPSARRSTRSRPGWCGSSAGAASRSRRTTASAARRARAPATAAASHSTRSCP